MDVNAWRGAKGREVLFGRTHRRRSGALGASVGLQPFGPAWPPRALLGACHGQPRVGIDIWVARMTGRHVVPATAMAGLRHDAGIVPAIGEHEGEFVVGEQVDLVDLSL